MSHPDRLSAQDVSFLTLEDNGAAMNIGALVTVADADNPLTVQDLRHLFLARIHLIPRLRRRLALVPGSIARPRLVDDTSFDIDQHIRSHRLNGSASSDELVKAVGRLNLERFDRSRPLWDVTLITGSKTGHSSILLRSHHAFLDGMSAFEIARTLFDTRADQPPGMPHTWSPTRVSRDELIAEAVAEQLVDNIQRSWNQAADQIHPITRLDHEISLLDGVSAFLRAGPKPNAAFGSPSTFKPQIAIGDVEAQALHEAAKVLGATDQALALALTASMLSRHFCVNNANLAHQTHQSAGSFDQTERVRTLVPMAIHVRDRRASLGNHASFVIVDLPTAKMSETERLQICARELRQALSNRQAETSARLIDMSNSLSTIVSKRITSAISAQPFVDVVVSYMRGPKRTLYLAGRRHLVTHPVMPLGRGMVMMAGVTHLGDRWGCSLTVDPARVCAPGFLLAGLRTWAGALVSGSS